MEEILHQFGFNGGLFVAQIINFLILAFLFKKFLYASLLKMLDERKKKIEQGLKDSEKAAIALSSANAEREKILNAASTESQAMIEDTKKAAEQIKEEILADARTNAEKIIAEAKKQSELEMERMRKEASTMSLALSKSILNTVIKGLFTKEQQAEVMKKGLKEIERHG
jgi:F-type H+-transporting ATPase subunit b